MDANYVECSVYKNLYNNCCKVSLPSQSQNQGAYKSLVGLKGAGLRQDKYRRGDY